MAIKRTTDSVTTIPQTLDGMLQKAFTFQQLRDNYGDMYDASKPSILDYLNNNEDGFTMVISDKSKSLKCDYGTLTLASSPRAVEINYDALIQLVQDGKITLASVLTMMKPPKVEDAAKLQAMCGDVQVVTVKSGGEVMKLQANSEFKAQVAASFAEAEGTPIAPKAEAPKAEAAKPADANSSLAKVAAAKAAKTKKANKKTADDDLADILGE